jgi:thioredoxin reductase
MDPTTTTPAPAGATRRSRRSAAAPAPAGDVVDVDVAVVGAGQAGLAAAHHLRRAGLVAIGSAGWQSARATFVVLDENAAPGGAWQHRWPALTMAAAHHVHDLPGMALPVPEDDEQAAVAVPEYFAQYEDAFDLNVQRPVRVDRVEPDGDALVLRTHSVIDPSVVVRWRARGLVNATGTWTKPFWPAVPGRETFAGRQLHVRDFHVPEDLADGPVIVVGGGTSAVQLLLLLAPVTTTTWVTRRPPAWRDEQFTPELGREAVAVVDERARAGLPPGSVVSATGLPLTEEYRAGIEAGVLVARPMFDRLEPGGAVWDRPAPVPADDVAPGARVAGGWVDGPAFVPARTVLWATGFRPALDHLAPLRLRTADGGIVVDGSRVVADPRVQLVGYGPSASTIGATRAAREAVRDLRLTLGL